MHSISEAVPQGPRRDPGKKGKLTSAKPPLLQIEGRARDLAMFNLAIDSKLRGCDVVNLMVENVAPHGAAVDRATVRQRKTGRPVRFEMTEQTREAVDEYLRATGGKPGLSSSPAAAAAIGASRPGSMLGLSPGGSPASGSTRASMGRIRYAEPKRPSSTAVQAICARCSCSWATPRSKAPSAISGLRSMTLSPSRNRSTSELQRQSGLALPLFTRRNCARFGLRRANLLPVREHASFAPLSSP